MQSYQPAASDRSSNDWIVPIWISSLKKSHWEFFPWLQGCYTDLYSSFKAKMYCIVWTAICGSSDSCLSALQQACHWWWILPIEIVTSLCSSMKSINHTNSWGTVGSLSWPTCRMSSWIWQVATWSHYQGRRGIAFTSALQLLGLFEMDLMCAETMYRHMC